MREQVRIAETHSREVYIRVTWEVPEHRTPGGRSPMRPLRVQIHYSLSDLDRPVWIEMGGERVTDKPRPPYHRGEWPEEFLRRIGPDLSGQPQWLLDEVERYRPLASCRDNGRTEWDDGIVTRHADRKRRS